MQSLKKMQFHQSIHVFWHIVVTYDVSFPQASISKNDSVSLNQLKDLLPWQQAKITMIKLK